MENQYSKQQYRVAEQPTFTRVMPASKELEAAMLNSLIQLRSGTDMALQTLTGECFYFEFHNVIYRTIQALYAEGIGVSMVSVSERLLRDYPYERVSEILVTLSGLAMPQEDAMTIEQMQEVLIDYCKRRKIREAMEGLYKATTNMTMTLDEEVGQMQQVIDAIHLGTRENFATLDDNLQQLSQVIEDNQHEETRHVGILTGVEQIDELGGLPSDGLVMLGARSSHGKTMLATYLALEAMKRGRHIAFYSMEMSQQKVTARIVAMESGVAANRMLRLRLTGVEQQRVAEAMERCRQWNATNFYFDNRSVHNVDQILLSARALKKMQGLDMIVIDYMQLLGDGERRSENANKLLAHAAHRLHDVAQQLGFCVLALTQCNNATTGMPGASSFRDSGEMFEAADVSLALYNAERAGTCYEQPYADVDPARTVQVEFIKGRDLGRLRFFMGWDQALTRLYAIDQSQLPRIGSAAPMARQGDLGLAEQMRSVFGS